MPTLRRAAVTDIDPATLYRILQLRVEVFVVEQNAAYAELDGRDLEPDAELMWFEESGEVIATLRILVEDEARRIGRVATAAAARGRGLAAELMHAAVTRCTGSAPGVPIDLDAQEHLAQWYGRFGFEICGATFIEDRIPHVPMRRS